MAGICRPDTGDCFPAGCRATGPGNRRSAVGGRRNPQFRLRGGVGQSPGDRPRWVVDRPADRIDRASLACRLSERKWTARAGASNAGRIPARPRFLRAAKSPGGPHGRGRPPGGARPGGSRPSARGPITGEGAGAGECGNSGTQNRPSRARNPAFLHTSGSDRGQPGPCRPVGRSGAALRDPHRVGRRGGFEGIERRGVAGRPGRFRT